MKISSFNKLYLRIFVSITVVVFLPLVFLSSLFFSQLIDIKTNNFEAVYKSKSENVTIFISEIMKSIENEILNVNNDSVFSNYIYIKQKDAKIDGVVALSKRIYYFKQKYSFVDSVYLYDPLSDTVFTDSAGSYDAKEFENISLLSLPPKDEIWRVSKQDVSSSVDSDGLWRRNSTTVISLLATLDKDRILAINIDPYKFGTYISNYYDLELGCFVISDNWGNIFLNTNLPNNTTEFSTIDFSNEFKSYKTELNYGKWSATLYVPKNILTSEINLFIFYSILVVVVLFIACLIVSINLTKYIYKPIDNLMFEINEHMNNKDFNSKDEIKYFKNVFAKITSENQKMSDSMEVHESLIRVFTFKDFLTGKISDKEFEGFCLKKDINVFDNCNKILVFTTSRDIKPEPSLSQVIEISKVIEAYINNISKGMFFKLNNYYVAIVSSDNSETLSTAINSIIKLLNESFNFDVFIGHSFFFSTFKDAPCQYLYAVNKLGFSLFFDQAPINYDNQNDAILEPDIPINIQTGLIRALLLKKFEDVDIYIDEFIKYLKKVKSMRHIRKVCFMLIALIEIEFPTKTIFGYSLHEKVDNVETSVELKDFLVELSNGIIAYLSSVSNETNHYVELAKKYIEDNYTKNIGVTNISDNLKISYPYLSKLFKDSSELSIVDYINIVRVNKAKELLESTDYTINQISEQVGYNNIQSFQRFFKKFTQTTPGEYRKLKCNLV